jgi:glycosyltransferase involved in cell wall biosynthesis
MNYVLMMPTLNEQKYISQVIESVINQTIRPILFGIIDGGSSDKTRDIIKKYIKDNPWIHLLYQTNYIGDAGHKKISCAMVQAYQWMVEYCFQNHISYDYIGHTDADLLSEPNLFETMITELENDYRLGAVGGVLYTDGKPEIYPADEIPNARMYRARAIDVIGGYPYSRYSWDSVILAKLRLYGFEIKACEGTKVTNLRTGELTVKNRWNTAVSFGEARYYLGYSLPLFLAGTAYAMKNNGLIYGVGLMKGFFGSIGTTTTKDEQVLYYYRNERLNEILRRNTV